MTISAPCAIDGGVLPVRSTDDVLALLPSEVRKSVSAPVRDALVAALTEIFREYQRRSRRCAAMADILRAKGDALAALGDDHDIPKQPGETDPNYRARLLGIPELVTPDAIMAAVNAILAPFTTKRAKYFESELDCWFVEDSTATWQSFVFTGAAAASPHYTDRLYPDDVVENAGVAIENREVLGAWVFSDQLGRTFVLRLPQLEAVDNDGAYAFSDVGVDDGMFVADGSDAFGSESDGTVTSFIYTDQAIADELYAAIVATVEVLKGQGMRWAAWVDPLL